MLRRVLAFFSPMVAWQERVRDRNGGRVRWPAPVEGKPDLAGFPWQWTLARPAPETKSGLQYPQHATCDACERDVEPTGGVRCARCGIVLHEVCAGMTDTLSTPTCTWCRSIVRAV